MIFIVAFITAIAGFIGSIIAMGLLVSLPVMLLWDWLMPLMFGLPTITWLQSWGLLVLSGLLFKSKIVNKKG